VVERNGTQDLDAHAGVLATGTGMLTVRRGSIRANRAAGIYVLRPRLLISAGEIHSNGTSGVVLDGVLQASIEGAQIYGNTLDGITLAGLQQTDLTVFNSTIRSNGRRGIDAAVGVATVRASILEGNVAHAIHVRNRAGLALVHTPGDVQNTLSSPGTTYCVFDERLASPGSQVSIRNSMLNGVIPPAQIYMDMYDDTLTRTFKIATQGNQIIVQ
jgi:hypothetical protein